jgi:hypothetical protein
MNLQTEALAKQAAEYAIEFATQDQALYIPKLMEKFAELIVRECAGVAIDNGCGDFVDIKQKLFEHFGVEQ